MHSRLFAYSLNLDSLSKISELQQDPVGVQISLKFMLHLCKNHSILVIMMPDKFKTELVAMTWVWSEYLWNLLWILKRTI